MRKFTVAVDENAAEQLTALARAERRDPREQAGLLLEEALARLTSENNRRRAPRGSQAQSPPQPDIHTEPAAR